MRALISVDIGPPLIHIRASGLANGPGGLCDISTPTPTVSIKLKLDLFEF